MRRVGLFFFIKFFAIFVRGIENGLSEIRYANQFFIVAGKN
ncbi:conserved hypothetical protein [Treponema phagedenis]|uniref:Uncharacterized protein n=1 Tax=Treponema phagedenis TaxID=162 RepID=A0A0B7GZA0_TREPH|nr:hypothetical protein HMPREF9554_00014 [Treponema phagedenis F0421]CEM62300.1 conserved hypothetical protein [Treponema phagedenis]